MLHRVGLTLKKRQRAKRKILALYRQSAPLLEEAIFHERQVAV